MKAASIALRIAATLLLLVLTWQAWQLPHTVGAALAQRIDPTIADLRATNQQAKNLLKDVQDSLDDTYYDYKASIASATVASRSSAELIEDLRANLMGGKDTRGNLRSGILPEVQATVADIRRTAVGLESDLHQLAQSTDQALVPLNRTLQNVAALTATLDKEVQAGSPKAIETLASINRSVEDFDHILADPNIQQILASSAATSEHLSESAKSIDIAMRPWREKAQLLKTVLTKALGLFKFAWTF